MAEKAKPDEGKKKCPRAGEEGEASNPILAVPLQVVLPSNDLGPVAKFGSSGATPADPRPEANLIGCWVQAIEACCPRFDSALLFVVDSSFAVTPLLATTFSRLRCTPGC